jgi:hypothetical protein
MRRWTTGVVVIAILVTGGCREMFQARPETVAAAAGQTLGVERVAGLMASIKGFPMTGDAAEFLANMWIDHTILAQALASGRDLTDSTTAAAVLWPELSEFKASAFHDSLVAQRVPVTDQVADSIYAADQVRLLQHILIRLEPNAEPPMRASTEKKAAQALARAQRASDFARLAGELSDDPGSKRDGGYLPPAPRGQYVTAFDSAGWTLPPGGMTGLIETPYGFHIIRRPPAGEVRERMLAYARERLGMQLDSMYLDSLGRSEKLKVDGGAAATLRHAIADRAEAVRSTRKLATWNDGELTVAKFMRWAASLPPSWASQLEQQPDSSIVAFVEVIGKNELLLREADRAGIVPSTAEWASLYQRYTAQIDTLRMNLGLTATEVSDPAASASDRSRVAAMKVESFWDKLAVGGARPRPVPPQLAYVLRLEASFSVHPAAIARAVEAAKALEEEKKRTAGAAPAGPQPGALMPLAPGAVPPGAPPTAPDTASAAKGQ